MDGVGVDFGDRNIDAEFVDCVQVKKLAGIAGPGTGIDQIADIGVACGYDAVKRRNDALVALQLFEPCYVGLACVDSCLRRDVIGSGLVRLLLRELRPVYVQPIETTGMLMSGKMSVGVRRITTGAAMRINSARTINVYGLLRETLAIHMVSSTRSLAPLLRLNLLSSAMRNNWLSLRR